MKKLYCVTYTIHAYVLAEDMIEAMELGEEAVGDTDLTACADADEVTPNSQRAGGWEDRCLVYQEKRTPEIKLGDVWPKKAEPVVDAAKLVVPEPDKKVDALASLAEDARCWRSLLACERIRFIGGANLNTPNALVGFDFHRSHPDREDSASREILRTFVRQVS
jgi:hypothetical protein